MKALARLIAGVAVAGCLSLPSLAAAGQPSVRVQDLNNRPTDPFQASRDANVIVFLFTSVDCPISNRYAPEVQRLYGAFRSKGVEFWLVYPNPSESVDAIRKHMEAFSYPMRALRDPQHALAKLAHATVTPEAAVYDVARRLVYRGRIDNRYVNLGLERPSATKRDLDEVLSALVAGKAAPEASAPAVGCFIADFVQ